MTLIHKNIIVRGKVQGVYFRASAKQVADQLGVNGMVKNDTCGSVYLEAEGEENAVHAFIKWCGLGPPSAEVTGLEVSDIPAKGYTHFEVVR